MSNQYTFELRGPLPSALREQAACIVAAIPEGFSRKACPKLWKLTDRINDRPKADAITIERRRKMRTALGLFELLLSLFALGPALVAPDELMSVLFLGTICLGGGIGYLWKRHRILLAVPLILAGLFYGIAGLGGTGVFRRLLFFGVFLLAVAVAVLLPRGRRKNKKFQKDGYDLFDARNALPPDECLHVCFTDQGMEVRSKQEKSCCTPYADFLFIIESQDLILLGVDQKGFLLSKSELTEGVFAEFKEAMSEKVSWIVANKA